LLLFLGGLALGATLYALNTADDDCADRDYDERCTKAEIARADASNAYDVGYENGFAAGFEAQIDPCAHWKKEREKAVKDFDLWSRLVTPVATDALGALIDREIRSSSEERLEETNAGIEQHC